MKNALLSASLAVTSMLAAPAFAQSAPEKVDRAPQGAPAMSGSADRLDLDQAVQRALEQTPGLAAAHLRHDAAEAQSKSLRGRLLPSINLSEEFQHYSTGFSKDITLGPPGTPPASFPIRDQNTNLFVAAASQPLLGLLHLSQDEIALNRTADAADEQARAVEAAVREQVATGYLHYFEARAMVDIAKQSEAQLTEQRTLADARLRAGVVTNADVLRIETAQANAKLDEVEAQSQVDATKAALLVTLGYPAEANVDFVEPSTLLEQVPAVADDPTVQRLAEQKRPEVKAAQLSQEAADHQSRSKLFALLPEVNAEAAYVKINGQPLASPEDKYIGVKATWQIFDWGADYYAYQASSAQAEAAAKAAEDQARNVRIDAAQRLAHLRAAMSAVEVAKTAIASATEAYRVTNVQVKAGVATSTTDLLDAQSRLNQAELNLVRAKYERAIANIALKRAVGE